MFGVLDSVFGKHWVKTSLRVCVYTGFFFDIKALAGRWKALLNVSTLLICLAENKQNSS